VAVSERSSPASLSLHMRRPGGRCGRLPPVCCGPVCAWLQDLPGAAPLCALAGRGLAPKSYGSSLEIDHIVSLELGGSNDPANLYPEELTYPNQQPGFRIKDKLETKAATAVCAGTLTLSYVQHRIAANWKLLYKQLHGVAPTGT
jgi:hypothetical protein